MADIIPEQAVLWQVALNAKYGPSEVLLYCLPMNKLAGFMAGIMWFIR